MEIATLGVDHCHKSESQGIMKVRGLLCNGCNIGLSRFKDDINLLQSAITYLQKHQHQE